MNTSLKKIQDAMLILHQETAALAKNQERIDKILEETSKTLTGIQKGRIPNDEEALAPKKVYKKRKSKKSKKDLPAPISKVAQEGNGGSNSKRGKPLSDEEKKSIKELDKEGMAGQRIAKAIGRSQTTVAHYIRDFLRSSQQPSA